MAKTRNMQQIVLRIALGLRGQAIQAGYPQSILATLKTWDHCLIGKTIATEERRLFLIRKVARAQRRKRLSSET